MAAIPPPILLTLNMLNPGVKYQIYNLSGNLVGTGIFDRSFKVGGNLYGIFLGIRTGIGSQSAKGFGSDERTLDNYYYRFVPTAAGGYKKNKKKTRRNKKLKSIKVRKTH